MNEIKIRVAGETDAETIVIISRETFYSTYSAFNTEANMYNFMQEFFSPEKIRQELQEKHTKYLIAYNDSGIAGYVKLKDKSLPEINLNNDNVIEIARIYTSTNNINKGIGSMMMNECIKIAKELKRDYIWLGVWENNLRAFKFYERFGFKKTGEHLFALGDDIQTDWLMIKDMSQADDN